MATRMVLIRHGETDWNAKGLIQGDSDLSRLNANGIRQCKRLALKVSKMRIDAAYASPLTRAADTAKAIVPAGMPIIKTKRLRERHFGSIEGLGFDRFIRGDKQRWQTWRESRELPEVKDVETVEHLQARAMQAVIAIAKGNRNKTVLVVTHGAFIRYLLAKALKLPFSLISELNPANCSVNVIEFNGQVRESGMQVMSINGRRVPKRLSRNRKLLSSANNPP